MRSLISTVCAIIFILFSSFLCYGSEVFDSNIILNDNLENTWVCTGGEAVQGGKDQTNNSRNYVGHFEEALRFTYSKLIDQITYMPGFHRFVINTGEVGVTTKDVNNDFLGFVKQFDPKVVALMVGKEDYGKGKDGLEEFKKDLTQVIVKILNLRSGFGVAVIQTPFKVLDEESNCKIREYVCAINDSVNSFSQDDKKRIIVIDNFTDFDCENYQKDGKLNVLGHYEIAKRMTSKVIKQEYDLGNWVVEKETFNDKPILPIKPVDNYQKIKDIINHKAKVKWLFLGDSITHGALHTFGYDGFVQVFEKFLKDDLRRSKDVVINTALSGATTSTFLEYKNYRFDKYKDCDIVFIMFGTNDCVCISQQEMKENLKTIINDVINSGGIPILMTPPPVNARGCGLTSGLAVKIEDNLSSYIDIIRSVAKEKDVILIDHYKIWENELEKRPYLNIVKGQEKYWNSNSVHPNELGHLNMARSSIMALGFEYKD